MKHIFLATFLILLNIHLVFPQNNSLDWAEIKKVKKGKVTGIWFQNNPYSFTDESGQLKGIEVEIVEGFQKYLFRKYQIDVTVDWVEKKTFIDVLNQIKEEREPGIFGLAGFSFSEERKTFMKFSPSYMADIAVLVSTQDIPIVKNGDDLKKYLTGTTALTAQGTVLEKDLIALRKDNQIDYTIEYTGASQELIKVLATRKKSFGYLSLPVYLMNLDKGGNRLNRQNYLTKRYEGRGIGLPKVSDWDEPLNEYFQSDDFKQDIELIIGKYVNMDLYHFIETFNPQNEVSLLNKEKDIQKMQLSMQELIIADKNLKQYYLLITVSVVTLLLVIIGLLFRKQVESNRLLHDRQSEIEAQANQIMTINNNLELIIQQRTQELQNKNKALEEYAFILAHQLRAPLTSILGLVNLMNRIKLSDEDKVLVTHLDLSAKKLDDIIHSVLEAINRPDLPNTNR